MEQTGNDKQTSMAVNATKSAYLTSVPIPSNTQPSITAAALPLAPEGTAQLQLISCC